MLWPEEDTLAILRWRLGMPPGNRWYKVLQRYVCLVAARVDGRGGNSGSIEPFPVGAPPRTRPGRDQAREYEGKICEVRYGCVGEFDGFILATCEDGKIFRNCPARLPAPANRRRARGTAPPGWPHARPVRERRT